MQPSNLQLYELAPEVLHAVDRLDNSLDELLAEARALKEEMVADLVTRSKMRAKWPAIDR
jgi:hypothetical protein